MKDVIDDTREQGSYVRNMMWTILLAVVGIVAFLWLLVFVASGTVTRQVRERWEASEVTHESLSEQFPTGGANASALEAEKLARAMGLELAPRGSDRWELHPLEHRRVLGSIKNSLGNYVKEHVRRDHRRVEAPPEDVARFLDAHAAEIDALRDHLVTAEEPRWEQDVDAMFRAPVPNLLAQLDLQRVFHAHTLARVHAGDPDGALRSIEASWRLGAFLRSRPNIISQLLAVSITRSQVGILRQLDGLPAIWPARLRGLDIKRPFLDSLRFDSWIWAHADWSMMDGQTGPLARAAGTLFAPYFEYCFAEASDRMRDRLDRLAEITFLCDSDLSARGVPMKLKLPPWNAMGYIAEHGVGDSITRVARLEVDIELTAKILEANAARRAAGRWPEEIPGIERSEACPHDRWLYEVGDDGVTISFPRSLKWPESRDPVLSTRFLLGS